ncbi:MAG: hypothetical protein Q7U83_08215 [Daejeonella sp.]|nr:hypothetical protein [Daejeonella sp.]
MKSQDSKKQKALEKEYHEITNGFQNQSIPPNQVPQWTNPTHYITKFSLYQESPNSITSTDTSVYLG